MNLVAKDIGVDAGMIMVADLSYLKEVSKRANPDKLGEVFDVKNGEYVVSWTIPETWNDKISGVESLKITSGKIFVCDPCYVIGKNHKAWIKWLEATEYGEDIESDKAFVISSMGGDGCYEVQLELIPVPVHVPVK